MTRIPPTLSRRHLGLALGLAITGLSAGGLSGCASTTPAAPQTLTVRETVDLPQSADQVWHRLAQFGNLTWHPAVRTTTLNGAGNVPTAKRTISTKDDAELVEILDAYSAEERRYQYHLVSSPLPVSQYVATLSVSPNGEGSRVTWEGQFQRSEAAVRAGTTEAQVKDIIRGIYRAGLDALKTAP